MHVMKNNHQRTRQLLFDIQDSPVIQKYLHDICADMQGLMQAFALEVSMRKTGVGNDEQHDTIPNASVYANVYNNLLCTAARGNIKDTGWVVPSHVMPVLTEGNARERCFVMSNLLFKDPETALICWLLDKHRCLEPSCINEFVVNEYRKRVQLGACRRHTLGARPPPPMRKILCGKYTHRNKKIRFPRARGERTHFKLLESGIVPELSTREHHMIGDYMNSNEGFLPWRTGRMYWQLKESSHFVHAAHVQHQSIISGHSGHTDAMLTFSHIFRSFDLKCMTLVCVLWLCGCEHHSVFEVVTTAHEHGLAYQQQDAIQFASELLQSLT